MIVEPLTRAGFAAFGAVIETAGAHHFDINAGFATRYDDIARAEAFEGAVKISIFEARPRPLPIAINMMERHPLGSQAFYPLQNEDWLVVVCSDPLDASSFRCFRASGQQGVNYARGTWHFPLLVFAPSRFLVVDRVGGGNNLEECELGSALAVDA